MKPIYATVLVAFLMSFQSARPCGGTTYKATVVPPPSGFTHGFVLDISGDRQVGWARAGTGPFTVHAVLWEAETAIDLNPPGYATTTAIATDGQTHGGFGSFAPFGSNRALLWRGTAESVVDLHPSEFPSSEVHDVSGDVQIGTGLLDDGRQQQRALMWRGSAESVVHLHPAGFENSYASSVRQ